MKNRIDINIERSIEQLKKGAQNIKASKIILNSKK